MVVVIYFVGANGMKFCGAWRDTVVFRRCWRWSIRFYDGNDTLGMWKGLNGMKAGLVNYGGSV